MQLELQPKVGVARLGNSPSEICLSPDSIGGLPFDSDDHGNASGPIRSFKDPAGLIKRQGQPFRLVGSDGNELTLDSPNVQSITWTVHLANKKAAWYQYSELEGNLLYGQTNSYEARKVPFRNAKLTTRQDRQTLIVDPGPRSISGRDQSIGFNKESAPAGYPIQYPPERPQYGSPVKTLGDLLTDSSGRLVVLGGYGCAGGDDPLTSYGGSDTWHDDISDGPVYCEVQFKDGSAPVKLSAWCVVGSPDFAPEIVNISTLGDTMFDVAVRTQDLVPAMCKNGVWNGNFIANFQRDVLPIIQRIGRYQWVANVQSMMAFTSNVFDFTDAGESNRKNRENYFSYFREPDGIPPTAPPAQQPQQKLFADRPGGRFPGMPLNSGSNSVSNTNIVKFLALDDTQQFLMGQWAAGKFEHNPHFDPYPIAAADAASVGNCVGLPMCPGIEVTWSLQNPRIYSAPFRIADEKGQGGYDATGLDPSRDECDPALAAGCQPGDLTKRMACPWQADFFQCTVQPVNFTDPQVNKDSSTPKPPTYYSYWWPPQSPWDVLTGEFTAEGQAASNLPAGQQMNYARGINSFVQMVEHWSALGFIRNLNAGDEGFPYFVETERVNELFTYDAVPVGQISGNEEDNETTVPVFFIESQTEKVQKKSQRAKLLVQHLEESAFRKIEVHPDGLGLPRSGTRLRR